MRPGNSITRCGDWSVLSWTFVRVHVHDIASHLLTPVDAPSRSLFLSEEQEDMGHVLKGITKRHWPQCCESWPEGVAGYH